MDYIVIGVAIVFTWLLVGIASYTVGKKHGRVGVIKEMVGVVRKVVESAGELIDSVQEEVDDMTDGEEIDEFLKTHECSKHKPVKSASERRRIAESLKAQSRNRKPTGQFAKGSKPKK